MKTLLQSYCYLFIIFFEVHSQVFPELYFFPLETDLVAVNGSSSTGRCSNFISSTIRQNCYTPTSSVLCDGNVPTLTGLDGDMWASQLLTINTTANTANITFDFTDTPDYTGVRRVEVVMFNCPEWGISVQLLQLFSATSTSGSRNFIASISPTTTSCDSLVRVCISHTVCSIRPVLTLVFTPPSSSNWVHLAEVTLYTSDSTCSPDTIITPSTTILPATPSPTTALPRTTSTHPTTPQPPPTTPQPRPTTSPPITSRTPPTIAPPPTTSPPPTSQTTQEFSTRGLLDQTAVHPSYNMTQCELCLFCCPTTIKAFIILAIMLAAVISVVVQIAAIKLYLKYRSGGAIVLAGGEEPVYEVVGDAKDMTVVGDKEVMDHIYTEIGEIELFQLKENEAYGHL